MVSYTDLSGIFPFVAKKAHDVRIPVLASLLAGLAERAFVLEPRSLIAPDRGTVEIEDFQIEPVEPQFAEGDSNEFPDDGSPVPLSPQIGRANQDTHKLSTEIASINVPNLTVANDSPITPTSSAVWINSRRLT